MKSTSRNSEQDIQDAFLVFDFLKLLAYTNPNVYQEILKAYSEAKDTDKISTLQAMGKQHRDVLLAAGADFFHLMKTDGAPNPYVNLQENYIDPMYALLIQQYPHISGMPKNPYILRNRSNISHKDSIWNIISSITGAVDSAYTNGFWRNLIRLVIVGLVDLVNWAHLKVFSLAAWFKSTDTQKYIPLIPYTNFSTLDCGNPPYLSQLKITRKSNDTPTNVIEMGMPTIVSLRDRSNEGFFKRLFSAKCQCDVSQLFKNFITGQSEPFLYVCLLQNDFRMFEVAHVEALKKFGDDENNQFFFMQTPPKHAIESIIKQLQGKDNPAQEEQVKAMILNNTHNFFISEKIKLRFTNTPFDSMVTQVVNEAFQKFPNDLFNVINEINAALTSKIHKAVSPANMCMVCKDGIDRGHAFKLNLQKYLRPNDPPINMHVRAQVIAGRNINFNGQTCERYLRAENRPPASKTSVSPVVSGTLPIANLATGAFHPTEPVGGQKIKQDNPKV
ncbi:MAG: hypothetical protein FJ186_02385 [Gammaproteobacteria bacterium]|nr:hypothetical protein [Gammaproteobacteria bacterium]